MKKNLTKKLMLSVLTLAFAVVSLGASTFAWFTVGKATQAASFDASVKGGEGLDIAVTLAGENPTEWFSAGYLPENYIKNVIIKQNANNSNWKFDAVTPTAALVAGVNSFKGLKDAALNSDPATEGFVMFDIHFQLSDKSSSTVYKLYIEQAELSSSTPTAWKCDYSYDLANGKTVQLNSENAYNILAATRMAIIQKGTDEFKEIYEQSANNNVTEKTIGEGESVKTYYVVNNGYNTVSGSDAYGAADYYEKKTSKTLPAYTELNASTTKLAFADNKLSAASTVVDATFSKTDIITLTVMVWVEGWDQECLNALFAQSLAANFTFGLRDQADQPIA